MKRKQLTHTAKDLFFKYGIKRVTIEEICQEAGVSKMTFYKHFKNKNELVKTMVTQITDEALEKYRKLMSSDVPFEEKVRQTILMKFEGTDQMSQEFLSDYITHADPDMLEFMHERSRLTMALIIKDYTEAQKRGEIRKDVKIEFILWYLNKMIDLMGDKDLEKLYDSPQEMIMEQVNFFFYGIMPHK
ncbi:MAG TPA: TetR/AcrR family transcriptional regulator [Bacteroides sp.]|nr:TetR/AcrR family transcriptional regulator [Bacteroides sp.]